MLVGQSCSDKNNCSETLCLRPPISSVINCMDYQLQVAVVSTTSLTGGGRNILMRDFTWVKASAFVRHLQHASMRCLVPCAAFQSTVVLRALLNWPVFAEQPG